MAYSIYHVTLRHHDISSKNIIQTGYTCFIQIIHCKLYKLYCQLLSCYMGYQTTKLSNNEMSFRKHPYSDWHWRYLIKKVRFTVSGQWSKYYHE